MNSDYDNALETLLINAVGMAQDLREVVDDAIDSSGDPRAALGTVRLLEDWEKCYREFVTLLHGGAA